jgi:hypothetical protein
MPSRRNTDRTEAAVAVAKQYLRLERSLNILIVVLVVSSFLGTYLAMSLLPAIAVGVVLLVIARAPILNYRGTVQLQTDDDVGTVVQSFTGPTPPVLAFQWGVADEVTVQDSTVTYRISYLFGLRSVEMTVQTERTTEQNESHQVELKLTVGERPWSTYKISINEQDGRTEVKYEYSSTRRFGLRRIPQRVIAQRYRNKMLSQQGYTVVERDDQCGI